MSDSVRPHRQPPTRLPRPWDSPGKNTGVGCHFLLQCMKVKSESEVAQSCLTTAYQAPPSMGFSRQENWSGLPLLFFLHGLPPCFRGKEIYLQCRRHRFSLWIGKIPWRRKWQTTPVFLLGKFYERRSLVGYSPCDRKKDMTVQLNTHIFFLHTIKEIPRRRQWHPTPVLLPGKSHGRRNLVGCSPWGRTELDTTEAT